MDILISPIKGSLQLRIKQSLTTKVFISLTLTLLKSRKNIFCSSSICDHGDYLGNYNITEYLKMGTLCEGGCQNNPCLNYQSFIYQSFIYQSFIYQSYRISPIRGIKYVQKICSEKVLTQKCSNM